MIRDLTGQRFGKLVVVKIADKTKWRVLSGKKRVSWVCKCDCGSEIIRDTHILCYSGLQSCGCLKKEKQHFACDSKIHKTWGDMITRCYNSKRKSYYLYGGRGIKVCDEWLGSNPKGFSNFYNWAIANGYKEEKLSNGRNKLTLDRIDNDKNYSPNNCRWITNAEQQRNKRIHKEIEYDGETKTMLAWCHQYNLVWQDYYKLLRFGYDNRVILDYITGKIKLPEVQQLHNPNFSTTVSL